MFNSFAFFSFFSFLFLLVSTCTKASCWKMSESSFMLYYICFLARLGSRGGFWVLVPQSVPDAALARLTSWEQERERTFLFVRCRLETPLLAFRNPSLKQKIRLKEADFIHTHLLHFPESTSPPMGGKLQPHRFVFFCVNKRTYILATCQC